MANRMFKTSAEIENAKSILAMCYDSLTQIRENMFIVELEGKQGLIDIDNTILIEIQEGQVEEIGKLITLRVSSGHMSLNLNTLKLESRCFRSYRECGEAHIVYTSSGKCGILGSNGGFIMPPIYDNISVDKVKYSGISIAVRYQGHNFMSEVSADGLSVTKLDDEETLDLTVRLIATKFKLSEGTNGESECKLIYEVAKNNEMVTINEFDRLQMRMAYASFGMIHTWKNGYAGLVRTNGKVIIPVDRFISVDSIGYKGICIVGEQKGNGDTLLGIYIEDRGLVVNSIFEDTMTLPNIPITYLWRDIAGVRDWWILGNDGYVHKELVEAFPVKRLNIVELDACKINVYGHEYIVNSKMEVLKGIEYAN